MIIKYKNRRLVLGFRIIRDLGIVFLYGASPRARKGAPETIGGIEEGMDG